MINLLISVILLASFLISFYHEKTNIQTCFICRCQNHHSTSKTRTHFLFNRQMTNVEEDHYLFKTWSRWYRSLISSCRELVKVRFISKRRNIWGNLLRAQLPLTESPREQDWERERERVREGTDPQTLHSLDWTEVRKCKNLRCWVSSWNSSWLPRPF